MIETQLGEALDKLGSGRRTSVTFDDLAQLFAGLAAPEPDEDSRRALGHFASKHGCTATMRYSERRVYFTKRE